MGVGFHVREAEVEPGVVEVSLTRERRRWGLFGPEPEVLEVLARRRVSAHDLNALTTWASVLEQAAGHARDGTLGCFVVTDPTGDGRVRVRLYERVITPTHLHTTLLADRSFDAGDERSLVASAEFAEELRGWARRRNDERRAAELDERVREEQTASDTRERQQSARDLAAILRRVDHGSA